MEYINWNGKVVAKDAFSIDPDNRSFRYGDGFFETIKVNEYNICLEDLHFERFFSSLSLLLFNIPPFYTQAFFREQIQTLLQKNNHSALARVRLMVFRGNGTPFHLEDNHPNFVIQSWPLEKQISELNKTGLNIGIYREAIKAFDRFSAIKSNNYLCYLMGAFYAQQHQLNDALIVNSNSRIAESTIANIFIVENEIVKTPPLTEGCINGVYRKHLIHTLQQNNLPFSEVPITFEDLQSASEMFTTNAIHGIQWVAQCEGVAYTNKVTSALHSATNT